MKKFVTLFATVFIFVSVTEVHAQMMGFPNSSPDDSAIQAQQQEEQEGRKFLDDLNSKTVACSQFKDADFEKIGEYFMGQSVGDTSRHIAMNGMMKSMMGEQGEEQMHIAWGKRGSGCDNNTQFATNMTNGGGTAMMGYGMMNGWLGGLAGFWFLGLLTYILIVIVLVLLTIFLWQQIQKEKKR